MRRRHAFSLRPRLTGGVPVGVVVDDPLDEPDVELVGAQHTEGVDCDVAGAGFRVERELVLAGSEPPGEVNFVAAGA